MMDMTQEIDCNLCGSGDKTTIRDNLAVCNSCGLGFLSPRMTPDGYAKYYREQYDDGPYRCKVPERLKRVFFERVARYIASENVLDVGAGGGEYLDLFSESKTALEPSPKMRKLLKSKGFNVVPDFSGFNEDFDFIILRHTLEHFLDPVNELRKINQVMKKGAKIYIAVPNSLPTNRGRDWFRLAHTYYFSSYTLLSILSLSGFIIETMDSDREELWCIAKKELAPKVIGTPNWLPAFQARSFELAFKYRYNRLYRINKKLVNLFRSL